MKKKTSEDLIEKLRNLAKMSHGLSGKKWPLMVFYNFIILFNPNNFLKWCILYQKSTKNYFQQSLKIFSLFFSVNTTNLNIDQCVSYPFLTEKNLHDLQWRLTWEEKFKETFFFNSFAIVNLLFFSEKWTKSVSMKISNFWMKESLIKEKKYFFFLIFRMF